ncbi:S-Ena type endospore appendage [Bacillus mycoides]|uniref:S-Ena type endospore appendage n=1 Tax=Bacillus mycoides TaxID=1405 RepID=UPI003D64ED66
MENSCVLSPCCTEVMLIVDKFCSVYDTRRTMSNTLWTESRPQQADITISVDFEATDHTEVTINLSSGLPIVYTLNRGHSRTDSIDNALSVVVRSINTDGMKSQGTACITVYRKISF